MESSYLREQTYNEGELAPKGLRKRWQKHIVTVPAIAVSRKLVTLGSNITLLLLTLVGVAWTVEGLGPGAWGGAGAEEDTGPTRVDPEDPLAVAEAAVEAAGERRLRDGAPSML